MAAPRNETKGLHLAVVSLTQQAGERLQALAQQYAGAGQLSVQLREPAEGAIDWSSIVLWLIATGTVTAGGLWAGHGHWAGLGRDAGSPSAKKPGAGDVPSVTIGPQAAVGFVVLASAMLLLLFFFLDRWLAVILVSSLAVSSSAGLRLLECCGCGGPCLGGVPSSAVLTSSLLASCMTTAGRSGLLACRRHGCVCIAGRVTLPHSSRTPLAAPPLRRCASLAWVPGKPYPWCCFQHCSTFPGCSGAAPTCASPWAWD